jgi:superfamily II DNA/RNA helicase
MSTTFNIFDLPRPLIDVLDARGIVEPFPIQTGAIPAALKGSDIQGKAPTGSGKTLAFGIPLVTTVARGSAGKPRALVLAPTRELAEQITSDLLPMARSVGRSVAAVYGGVSYGPQRKALRGGVDILVATPGRLEDLIAQGSIDLSRVDKVVIDEADRMADMGFLPTVRRILDQTANTRQTMMFSATLDGEIAVLSRDYQKNPVRVDTGRADHADLEAVHHFWKASHQDRPNHTADVIRTAGKSIVFTRTRRGADRLAKQLETIGVSAVAMHGGRSQGQRTQALKAFTSGRAQALVATDVAARGIHVDDVATVIHYDFAGDDKDYLHRSGRTARAGSAGMVISLVTPDQEREVRRMQNRLDLKSPIESPQLHRLEGQPRPQPRPHTRKDAVTPPTTGSSESLSVYVGNLPWETRSNDLEAMFKSHGTVSKVTLVTDRRTGKAKGYGFVEMEEAAARRAVAALGDSQLGGRPLKVRIAT